MDPAKDAASPTHEPGRGYLIVIEGIDGTGKSTLARALAAKLRERGLECVQSREPTDGPYGRKIREIAQRDRSEVSLEEELNLFIEDRKEHVAQVIQPALDAGRIIVLDRYFYSTMAYQGARGADAEAILRNHRTFAPDADLLVILELDVESALDRVKNSRGSTPDAFEGEDYLRKVDAGFRRIEHPNLLRLNAGESTEQLAEHILKHLPDRFSGRSSL